MAGTIGGISFLTMQGRPLAAAEAGDEFARLGQDGAEYRLVGQREATSAILTIQTALDAAAADALIAANLALQGTVVTVVDAHGISHTGVLVVEVEPVMSVVGKPSNAPTHTRKVETRWTLRKLCQP